jgi:hypothetical protein
MGRVRDNQSAVSSGECGVEERARETAGDIQSADSYCRSGRSCSRGPALFLRPSRRRNLPIPIAIAIAIPVRIPIPIAIPVRVPIPVAIPVASPIPSRPAGRLIRRAADAIRRVKCEAWTRDARGARCEVRNVISDKSSRAPRAVRHALRAMRKVPCAMRHAPRAVCHVPPCPRASLPHRLRGFRIPSPGPDGEQRWLPRDERAEGGEGGEGGAGGEGGEPWEPGERGEPGWREEPGGRRGNGFWTRARHKARPPRPPRPQPLPPRSPPARPQARACGHGGPSTGAPASAVARLAGASPCNCPRRFPK